MEELELQDKDMLEAMVSQATKSLTSTKQDANEIPT
jgi:hypothetical protein